MKANKKWIGRGFIANGTNCNVLNLLRILVEDSESKVYIPSDYKVGSRVRIDKNVYYNPKDINNPVEVVGIRTNQSRFNFSLLCLKPVMVDIDGELVSKKVWRNYNVIRDGKLVINKIYAKLIPVEVFDALSEAALLKDNKGNIIISYHSAEELRGLIEKIVD
jgi:hypothetical protein